MTAEIFLLIAMGASAVFLSEGSDPESKVSGLFVICVNGHATHAHCKITEQPNSWRNTCSICRDAGRAELVSSPTLDVAKECASCLEPYGEIPKEAVGFVEARAAALYTHWLQNGLEDGSITESSSNHYLGEWSKLQGRLTKVLPRMYDISFVSGATDAEIREYRDRLLAGRGVALADHWPVVDGDIPTSRKEMEAILAQKVKPVIDE